ncbi:hypothetical protein Dsin_028664 [Dipteronia sinensis]|uniref:Uncharacterized protein n=1 Tax=Dipteronia sinensis TaxID=43782 RepID=A0AAD9ZQW0_9ROSI|nr:hypothetical protein Dsin_028664 [Dipteronia sinensis]
MDFDFADYKLNEATKKVREVDSCFGMSSPSKEAYRRQLVEIFNMNRTRILAFKNRPPTPVELIPQSHSKPTCSPLLHHSTDALFLRWVFQYSLHYVIAHLIDNLLCLICLI